LEEDEVTKEGNIVANTLLPRGNALKSYILILTIKKEYIY